MNGIIRTLTDNIEIEGVESIQIEEGFDGPDRMIKFFDAYGNSKDIPFKTFEMFSFEKKVKSWWPCRRREAFRVTHGCRMLHSSSAFHQRSI